MLFCDFGHDDLGIEVLVFVSHRKYKTNFWCEVLVFIDFCQFHLIILFMLVSFIQVKQLTEETLNK